MNIDWWYFTTRTAHSLLMDAFPGVHAPGGSGKAECEGVGRRPGGGAGRLGALGASRVSEIVLSPLSPVSPIFPTSRFGEGAPRSFRRGAGSAPRRLDEPLRPR